jgi:hypothetical protein
MTQFAVWLLANQAPIALPAAHLLSAPGEVSSLWAFQAPVALLPIASLMPTFDVHLFPVIRVKISVVDAPSPRDAVEETLRHIGPNFYARFKEPDSEFADEFSHYLVDVPGDADFRESQWFYSTQEPLLSLLRRLQQWDERGRTDGQLLDKLLADARDAVECAI